MNRVCRGIILGVILLTVSFCVVAVQRVARHVFSSNGYACTFDAKVSDFYKNTVFDFINRNTKFHCCSPAYISEEITKNFTLIKSIKLFRSANGVLSLRFAVFEPKFVVNKQYVITENKAVFEKKVFTKEALLRCGNIQTELLLVDASSVPIIPDSCKKMLFALPQECFEKYEIIRDSDTRCYLRGKSQQKFTVLCSDEMVPDKHMLSACEKLKKDLCNRGLFNERKVKELTADIRFKDQIVLCKNNRGRW